MKYTAQNCHWLTAVIFGDSLTASRLSVYQLNKDLDKESAYYTDINPEDFYNKMTPVLYWDEKPIRQ